MLIEGRLLVDPGEPPRRGWIRVAGDRIAELGIGRPPRSADLGDGDLVIAPGFVDAHVHLPQFGAIGCERDGLLPWLDAVIYPAERSWADRERADASIRLALRSMAAAGTLGFAGWLTAHAQGPALAAAALDALPLRATLGQVLMDRAAPTDLLRHAIAPLPAPTARRVFGANPRFAVACSDAMLAAAGRLAAGGAPIQTHIAEHPEECRRVAELFPDDRSYAAVYDRNGLLGPRSLLAHGVHLGQEELALIAARGATVVHCPGANLFLGCGLLDLAALHRAGVRLALGSDVAAGPDVAMPRVARQMIEVAKARRASIDPGAFVPSPAEAWRLITRGNAEALGFADGGVLALGAAADLLLLRAADPDDPDLIGRWIYGWENDLIEARILAGRPVAASLLLAPADA